MLSKNDIVFQDETILKMIYKNFSSLKENIVNTIFQLSNEIARELGISRLNKIIIRDKILFDNKRGAMFFKTGDVELSYQTVMDLIREDDEERYKRGLVTLRHELCHVLDCEQILCRIYSRLSDEGMSGYLIWTEFFATYSTFTIKEEDSLYDALESALKERDNEKYYLSRVFGYYLSDGHSPKCDNTFNQYFDQTNISNISNRLERMLYIYPNIPMLYFAELNKLFDNLLKRPKGFGEPIEDYISWIRNKQK